MGAGDVDVEVPEVCQEVCLLYANCERFSPVLCADVRKIAGPVTSMFCCCAFLDLFLLLASAQHCTGIYPFIQDSYKANYGSFSASELREAKEAAREMFYFAYENYMRHAFPMDELDPINCAGRGHDHLNPSNININDVLGDYSLSLIESLDTLVVFGNRTEFHNAIRMVINSVSFERNVTVQVFEATIRQVLSAVIGSLLSAHLILTDDSHMLGNYALNGYNGELLTMAHDLAARLLPAFDGTRTGLPFPRVNLLSGVSKGTVDENCPAGAGSLLLEFAVLSRLLGDSTYESLARRTNRNQLRRGRDRCVLGEGETPIYVNIDMRDGSLINTWIDALQASFAAVQVLNGDIDEAICAHAIYYSLWKRYDALPERYNWRLREPDVYFYPLRPELAESTYLLYRATQNPFYLRVGFDIVRSLNAFARVKCGYATVHNVVDKSLEDRMESFFLSETAKYLYLLFDVNNAVNLNEERILFTTEGHIIPIDKRIREPVYGLPQSVLYNHSCAVFKLQRHSPPLDQWRLAQIFHLVGIDQFTF
ncbi:unnamed protein product [Gongylonema pulchrum]|uniref:alpha-1,2-Mannosidase n=1 Tax=Gongylonema pulchrum TaxID=637853 RepID=A0A183DYC4_9BILA|nr:unnamed protein product [Gongylonema pulchrum]